MGAAVETEGVNQQAYRKLFTVCTGVTSPALKALLYHLQVYVDIYISTLGEDDSSFGFTEEVYLHLRNK